MSLFNDIVTIYPELTSDDFGPEGTIRIHNESGIEYVALWDYAKPIPKGIKFGK